VQSVVVCRADSAVCGPRRSTPSPIRFRRYRKCKRDQARATMIVCICIITPSPSSRFITPPPPSQRFPSTRPHVTHLIRQAACTTASPALRPDCERDARPAPQPLPRRAAFLYHQRAATEYRLSFEAICPIPEPLRCSLKAHLDKQPIIPKLLLKLSFFTLLGGFCILYGSSKRWKGQIGRTAN
jgi:hypothetical protein